MNMRVTELDAFTLLHVGTRGDASVMAKTLSTAIGTAVAATPGSVTVHGHLAVLWSGPGRWLIHADTPGWRLGAIDGCAVTDLSDSRRVFRLSGGGVGDFLAASCPLDLSTPSMPPGTCALTQFDRYSIMLHRRGGDEFDLYVPRSYAPALTRLTRTDPPD